MICNNTPTRLLFPISAVTKLRKLIPPPPPPPFFLPHIDLYIRFKTALRRFPPTFPFLSYSAIPLPWGIYSKFGLSTKKTTRPKNTRGCETKKLFLPIKREWGRLRQLVWFVTDLHMDPKFSSAYVCVTNCKILEYNEKGGVEDIRMIRIKGVFFYFYCFLRSNFRLAPMREILLNTTRGANPFWSCAVIFGLYSRVASYL